MLRAAALVAPGRVGVGFLAWLVELVVALTILAVGIGSLLTLLSSSAISLQRSDQKGTALVLAEKQMELYRSVGYKDIRLDDASVAAIAASLEPRIAGEAPAVSAWWLLPDGEPRMESEAVDAQLLERLLGQGQEATA